MIIVTTEGAVEVWAKTTSSLDRVVLASSSLETLRGVSASIELMGASQDDLDVGTYDEYLHPREGLWTLELDRTTFKLWFEFETDGYLRYGKNEFATTALWHPEHQVIINTIKGVIGT